MIVALPVLVLLTGVTGILLTTDSFWGSEAVDLLHGALVNVVLLFAAVHLVGVLVTSFRTRENLNSAMLTGKKRPPSDCDEG